MFVIIAIDVKVLEKRALETGYFTKKPADRGMFFLSNGERRKKRYYGNIKAAIHREIFASSARGTNSYGYYASNINIFVVLVISGLYRLLHY